MVQEFDVHLENSSNRTPGISIITPTHGRVDLLSQLLASLEAARGDYAGDTEVLIVDSSPASESVRIEQACERYDAQLHSMPNNVRRKRNWGIKHARYPIVLFIDSDCIADSNLLQEHAQLYAGKDRSNMGGVVGLTQFVGKDNWVWRMIQRTATLDAFSYPEHHRVVPWGPTCNISYWRHVVEQVGLFDESFPFVLGGDDADLGLRVTDAGYLLLTNAEAVVKHEKRTWTTISAIIRRRFRWGRMHFYLMRKHSHRVSHHPPTVVGVFLLLIILFVPLGLVHTSAIWTAMPLLWLFLQLILEALLISKRHGPQPAEFLYTLGAGVLVHIFQAGTTLEGIRNCSLAPLFQDADYCPPSPEGRLRGVSRLWTQTLALSLSSWLIVVLRILLRTSQ